MPLVVHSDMDIFLPGWNHLLLPLALKFRQLLHGLLNDGQGGVDLLFGDNERGCEANNVLMSRFGLCVGVSSDLSCA